MAILAILGLDALYSNLTDPLNKEKVRNKENTLLKDFNCGGYALGTYSWIVPVPTLSSIYDLLSYEREEDIIDNGNDYYNNGGYEIWDKDEIKEFCDMMYSNFLNDAFELNSFLKLPMTSKQVRNAAKRTFKMGLWNSFLCEQLAVKSLLKNFPMMREINKPEEVKENEYCIVYAMTKKSGGNDFHFARIDNGVITHKRGTNNILEANSLDQVFGFRYDGERHYFAMPYEA